MATLPVGAVTVEGTATEAGEWEGGREALAVPLVQVAQAAVTAVAAVAALAQVEAQAAAQAEVAAEAEDNEYRNSLAHIACTLVAGKRYRGRG